MVILSSMQLKHQDDEKTQFGEDFDDKVDNLVKIEPDEVALESGSNTAK